MPDEAVVATTRTQALGGTTRTFVCRSGCRAALLASLALLACGDRGSDLAVVYRGDVAAYRAFVHVQVDTGARARIVSPAFPSAARAEPIATHGDLPITVSVVAATGDTVARYSLPLLRLAPKTAYRVGIVVGRRPLASRCNGEWTGAAIAPGFAARARSDSLYVSVTTWDRTREQPRCDD